MSAKPDTRTLSLAHASKLQIDKTINVSTFMQYIAWGLKNSAAAIPSIQCQDLGDRSGYIGASAATGCLRKAYLDVKEVEKKHSPVQMFVFERGHQLEEMIRKGANGLGWTEMKSIANFKKGNSVQYVHQYEAKAKYPEWSFLKAHIDFIFVNNKELVIKEIKSSATIPESPYESHILQTTLQMWLVQQNNPDLKVRGSVVYHNWDTGESTDFSVELNPVILEVALNSAKTLWDAFLNNVEPEATTQLYCGKCPFKGNCSKVVNGAFTEMPQDLLPLVKRIQEFKSTEKEIKKLKGNLQSLLKATGIKKAKFGELTVDIIEVAGKKVLSLQKLKQEHIDIYSSLLENSGGYSFLKIT